jgi:hypothetical protein
MIRRPVGGEDRKRMSLISEEFSEQTPNPLDLLEDLVNANEWPFDRSSEDELIVEASGRWCDYRLFFVWRGDLNALYFTSVFDSRVVEEKRLPAIELSALVNEKLWLGHFEVGSEDGLPMFRYTMLTRGRASLSIEQLEDLVDIALMECERFYPALQFVVWAGRTPQDAMASAMMETMGEA